MSEYFCHAVHGGDCAALIRCSSLVSDRTKQVAEDYPHLMRMGSVLRAGRTLVFPALEAIRVGASDVTEERANKRIAIALSQLSHQATDGFFKPAYRRFAPEYYDDDYALSPSDMRILQDVVLYHARRGLPLAEGDPIYDSRLMHHAIGLSHADEPGAARFLETVFGGRVIQELLGLHTLFPQEASTDEKLRAYVMALDPVYIDTARYADLAAQPHHNLVQRYIVDTNFYDPDDPYVSLAVDVQNGAAPDADRLEAAKQVAQSDLSQWGVTLRLGVDFFELADAFMTGRSERGALEAGIQMALNAALTNPWSDPQ